MKIILASASPRRQELLKHIFEDFTVRTSACEEKSEFNAPSEYVMDLAFQKADDVAAHYLHNSSDFAEEDFLIIGADTIVCCDNRILGKPSDRNNARQMLNLLSGRTHEVYTGISLLHIRQNTKTSYTACECTHVHVDELSPEEIAFYLDTDEPYDKAGGYAIQGYFSRHIAFIEGDYFNVVGLPIHKLYELLKTHHLI